MGVIDASRRNCEARDARSSGENYRDGKGFETMSQSGQLRIAFLTARNPLDRRSWSGTHYHLYQALRKHCGTVTVIGPIQPIRTFTGKIISKALRRFTGRSYLYNHTLGLSRKMARMAEKQLKNTTFDLIFSPAASTLLAHLVTDIPIVSLSDTTFSLMHGYNPEFSNVLESSKREAEILELMATRKASLLLFSSSWAAASAIHDYGALPERVHIVPFGANFEGGGTLHEPYQHQDTCRLLFVGVDWKYKGGDIAFETLVELRKLGIKSSLTVVGCMPPSSLSHADMCVIPFLDKNDISQKNKLAQLFANSDFLIFPTRTDCFGIVACEACAFGLPVIATATGGVPEIVRDGVNGCLLSMEAGGSRYAQVIREVYSDPTRYERMRKAARREFETRLNWDAWGRTVARLLNNLVENERRSHSSASSVVSQVDYSQVG